MPKYAYLRTMRTNLFKQLYVYLQKNQCDAFFLYDAQETKKPQVYAFFSFFNKFSRLQGKNFVKEPEAIICTTK